MARGKGEAWSREEVEATVADYFRMLGLELAGQPYNKAAHNRALQDRLSERTRGAIELKHQNISAILNEMHCGYIPGYKPLKNYQRLLWDIVEERVERDPNFDKTMLQAVEREAVDADLVSLDGILVDPPMPSRTQESVLPRTYARRAVRRDYIERESRNRSLGLAGEKFVAEFECRRLHAAGHKSLANRVEHVAATKGDGLGYDVLSFEPNGRERFIEVKTTAFGAATPFYVTRNELAFSEEEIDRFVLARVHEFRQSPKIFELKGPIRGGVTLHAVAYVAQL